MRFKRMIALLCAAIYLTTAGAAAAEPLAETGEMVVSEAAESAEIQDSAVRGTEMPTVRASGEIAAPSVHKVQVNGKAVDPEVYLIGGYNYFKLRDIAYMLNGTSASFNVTWDGAQNAVNMLQEYCQSEDMARPEYETMSDTINDDNSHTFVVRCYLGNRYADGTGSKVKDAKKSAAYKMLEYLGVL